ncbi:MAG: hypothetical protein RL238_1882 [Actinomycetota bacterium]
MLYGLCFSAFLIAGLGIGGVGANDCFTGDDTCTADEVNGPLLFLGIVVIAAGALVVLGFYCAQLGRTGRTWGRSVRNLRVVDDQTGEPIGFARAVGRTLFANLVSSILFLGYLWMLWDPDGRTWHDKVAHTMVIVE